MRTTFNVPATALLAPALLTTALLLGLAPIALADDGPAPEPGTDAPILRPSEKTVLSKVYTVDQKYRSMMGPQSMQQILLGDPDKPELVWITGYKAVMVGADGETEMPQEFMCHSNLDINVGSHRNATGASHGFNPRLFTLSQGQFEVDLPDGYGIPMVTSEPLNLTTQVLNLNHENTTFDVRHKVSIEYIRDADVDGEIVPVFPVGAYGLILLEGDNGYFGVANPNEEQHGSGCLPGENAAGHTYKDHLGRTFTGHWVVKPGKEVNRTLVTQLMQLPYDTTAHYIAVHLHPFAESLELRDLTEDKTVFKSAARNYDEKIGLRKVEYFASEEGIQLYRDHEYEMVSVYNNTTEEEQDSMAVMYLYVRDQIFDKSQVKIPVAAAQEPKELQGTPLKSMGD